jgi:hypothetical protein
LRFTSESRVGQGIRDDIEAASKVLLGLLD